MIRKVLMQLIYMSLIFSAVYANPDGVLMSGDVRITGAGSGLVFPDGSIQYKAVTECEPLTLTSICSAIKAGGKSLPAYCPNSTPVANAGVTQTVSPNVLVMLDGSNSIDLDNNELTYFWAFVTKPPGSLANISNPTAMRPAFTPDAVGNYLISLVVNDGTVNSLPVTVSINVKEPNSVGGTIYSDTTLSLSSSPYNLTSNLQIASGVTVTIEPGVVVYGNNLKIEVMGNLNAIGAVNNPIHINNLSIVSVENAINYNIHLNYTYLQASALDLGFRASGAMKLTNSILKNMSIMSMADMLSVEVGKNIFVDSCPLSFGWNTCTVYVTNNVFCNQTTYAIYATNPVSSNYLINYNSFLTTSRIALYRSTVQINNIDATNNYWGTVDTNLISQMIYDNIDNISNKGAFLFEPFLSEPDPNTPDPASYM